MITSSDDDLPFVSIDLPVQNEEKHICECLDSLLNQDYPINKYEILVIDGNSIDKTKEIVCRYSESHQRVKLFTYQTGNRSAQRNVGILNAKGDIIVMFNGHVYAEKNFLSTVVRKLVKCDDSFAAVGVGTKHARNGSIVDVTAGLVMHSMLGGLGTTYRLGKREQIVDSIAFAAYRKAILIKVGMHDEKLLYGTDLELNTKIRKAGYKLLYMPSALISCHNKDSISKFAGYLLLNGQKKAEVYHMHSSALKGVHMIPSLFLLSIALLGITSFMTGISYYLLLSILSLYATCIIGSSIMLGLKAGWKVLILAPLLYIIEHTAYGIGFLLGLILCSFKDKLPEDNYAMSK